MLKAAPGQPEREFEAPARVGAERHLAPTRSRFCAYLRRSVHGRRAFELLSSARRTLQECSRWRPGQPDLFRNGVHSATDSSTGVHAAQRRGMKAPRAVTNPAPAAHPPRTPRASWSRPIRTSSGTGRAKSKCVWPSGTHSPSDALVLRFFNCCRFFL